MSIQYDKTSFQYRLNPEDLVKVGVADYKPVGQNEHGYFLQPLSGGPTTLVEHVRFCEGLRSGYIEVRLRHSLEQAQRSPVIASEDHLVSMLRAIPSPRRTVD